MRANAHIPVSVLTGYLGSGKTTLLNRLLANQRGRRYGVIVNEFGSIGIDGALIVDANENVIELNNGCLCCSVRGDLLGALETVVARVDGVDEILIETTGLADPAPIAATFLLDDDIFDRVKLKAIITLIDVPLVNDQIGEDPVVESQIALGDIVLLNKCDVASGEQLQSAEALVKSINRISPVLRTDRDVVDVVDLLAIPVDQHARLSFVNRPTRPPRHDVVSVSLTAQEPVDAELFAEWISNVIRRNGRDILRCKGIVAFAGEDRRFIFQGVQTILEGDVREPWAEGKLRESRLVFIGRRLDTAALRAGFETCLVRAIR
ncbi:GTP-binding protein [Hyphomicrobium sp.]|uniref:CobW family GTP-binding protein n=1 Tax=Hyphomicrobium sp. TaxID=82 RepID=UPI001D5B89FC|nr:GTP-binding protein [Hyphomicrobium sp.]MBY0558817.1 GTP-binding protein [Hyphomicrobium sp.]